MDEENKVQRIIIEDPLINGCGGLQVPFYNGLFPPEYLPKIFQKKMSGKYLHLKT